MIFSKQISVMLTLKHTKYYELKNTQTTLKSVREIKQLRIITFVFIILHDFLKYTNVRKSLELLK